MSSLACISHDVSWFDSLCSWSAISRAMNGTRNPRQIAARVQKMFSKLTRRGCDSAEPSSHILPAG